MSFTQLITKLEDAIQGYDGDGLNEEQCRVEAEIVGYLIGRKAAKKDKSYVPVDLKRYGELPLAKLNAVATDVYASLFTVPLDSSRNR